MEQFGKARKASIKHSLEKRENVTQLSRAEQRAVVERNFVWIDSPLESDPHDTDPRSDTIAESFRKLLPGRERNVKNYIEQTLKERAGKAIGIEFGGPGSELFRGFSKGFFEKSLGVTLLDHRYSRAEVLGEEYVEDQGLSGEEMLGAEQDTAIHHTLLQGDILTDETYERVNEWLHGRKASLIIERMGCGLGFLPEDEFLAGELIARWYELLDEGGIMFIQVPVEINHVFNVWASTVSVQHPETLMLSFDIGRTNAMPTTEQTVLMLQKLKGAPDHLPLLTSREVLTLKREDY